MMFSSFLNTLFLNIYSFFVGNRVGLVSLGYYTQGDKWSKMCVSSISQVLTSSFLPVLSSVQHEKERFLRLTQKMNRMTSYLVFPLFIGLIIEAKPIFHLLFGTKWDPSIILFQLLLTRGIFTVFTSLYSNYLLAVGHAGSIARLEIWRDAVALAGLFVTFPFMTISLPDNPVRGVEIMLWGQVIAAATAWCLTLYYVNRKCGIEWSGLIKDYMPYLLLSVGLGMLMYIAGEYIESPVAAIAAETAIGLSVYLFVNYIADSRIQSDAIAYISGKLK